ncbi:MAG: hypothetical protein OSJ43_00585 [Oscillospiraceae bacterium]|nr:hypothetical protein [Oscillospiraceae bacterium]
MGELLNVVRDRITGKDLEEIFAAAEQRCSVNMPTATVQTDKTAQKSSSGGAAFYVLFFAIWAVVIGTIVFAAVMLRGA